MPKRGDRLPYRVEFEYPPSDRAPQGVKGTEVRGSIDDAAALSVLLSRRGASGRVINRDTGETLATFTAQTEEHDNA